MHTSSGGTQVWSWDYDAFGNATPSGSVTVNLRMPGQYYDAESGQFYNWHRYYDPATGRYISSDPIGLDGGMNTYNYANVSPLMYTDPTGEFVQAVFIFCARFPAYCVGGVVAGTAAAQAAWQKFLAEHPEFAQGIENCIEQIGEIFNSDANPLKPAIPDAEPDNLCEQLALAEAKAGAGVIIMTNLNDEPRLVAHYGEGPWVKKQHSRYCNDARRVTIHYFHSVTTGLNVELKFVQR